MIKIYDIKLLDFVGSGCRKAPLPLFRVTASAVIRTTKRQLLQTTAECKTYGGTVWTAFPRCALLSAVASAANRAAGAMAEGDGFLPSRISGMQLSVCCAHVDNVARGDGIALSFSRLNAACTV